MATLDNRDGTGVRGAVSADSATVSEGTPQFTPAMLDQLIAAVWLAQRDALGSNWDAMQNTLARLDCMGPAPYDECDARWAIGVYRLYGLDRSEP